MAALKILWIIGFFLNPFGKNLTAQQPRDTVRRLDAKQQSIVTVSAFTAKGDLVPLRNALHEGLNARLSVNEMKEVIVHLYAYCGFPRSLNAIAILDSVVTERRQKGIKDVQGREASKPVSTKSKFAFGRDVQTKLTGSTATGAPQTFVPLIDTFLKEHLFADVFGRDVLDWKTREIATISALASMGGVEPQLRSHFGVGLYNGLGEAQLTQLVSLIQSKIGAKEGAAANAVWQGVLKQRRESKGPADGNLSTPNRNKMNDANPATAETIFPKGDKAPADYFTGTAWVNVLVPKDETGTYAIGNVVFEPGCRNNWHIHPAGQTLIVTDGKGWYQERGKPARAIAKGDVVVIPSNVEHWHGAARDSGMTHLAVTNGSKDGTVKWLGRVTDEEYNGVHQDKK